MERLGHSQNDVAESVGRREPNALFATYMLLCRRVAASGPAALDRSAEPLRAPLRRNTSVRLRFGRGCRHRQCQPQSAC